MTLTTRRAYGATSRRSSAARCSYTARKTSTAAPCASKGSTSWRATDVEQRSCDADAASETASARRHVEEPVVKPWRKASPRSSNATRNEGSDAAIAAPPPISAPFVVLGCMALSRVSIRSVAFSRDGSRQPHIPEASREAYQAVQLGTDLAWRDLNADDRMLIAKNQ